VSRAYAHFVLPTRLSHLARGSLARRSRLGCSEGPAQIAFPDRHASIGGKLANFIFCRNEHLTILTPSYLFEIAAAAGFERPKICIPGRTTTKPSLIQEPVLKLEAWSSTTEPQTLLIECYKPEGGSPADRAAKENEMSRRGIATSDASA
jgi:hypothetical protein